MPLFQKWYICAARTSFIMFYTFSVHPHRISLTTLRSEGLIVQCQTPQLAGGDGGGKSTPGPWVSVHPHRISLTTLRSEGLIVQHQPMLMIKRPADHDKVNPQKATTAHMWTTTLLQATQRSARHRGHGQNGSLLGAPLPQQDWNMHPDTGVHPGKTSAQAGNR